MLPRPPSPQSAPLPFPDEPVSTQNSSSDRRHPTAFISYTHETREHDHRVRDLAERLISHGVDCRLDLFEVSPPDGWTAWMRRQLEDSDFCIVVCTETYTRRFLTPEASGTGRGATYEGKLIRALLYRAGHNRGIIPVIFGAADRSHIPLELADTTYCNLATPDGYTQLHRILTNQPLVERPPIGPLRRRLPVLSPNESDSVALLSLCPKPLPLDVISRATRVPDVETTLARLTRTEFVDIDNGCARIVDRSPDDLPAVPDALPAAALGALLDFLEARSGAPPRDQVINATILQETARTGEASASVAHTFRIVQSSLKAYGDKHLLLQVARRSIDAARRLGRQRTPREAEDEVIALICGTSWVYQRIGRLHDARDDAETSLQKGTILGLPKNTAFCNKCLGRLSRMEADLAADVTERASLLDESVSLLSKALATFAELQMETEVGDCYSLLARTYLAQRRTMKARNAIKQAELRLLEPDTKDYLDLALVRADLMAVYDPRAADAEYTNVLAEGASDDAQKSEIVARAYFSRAKARAAYGTTAAAAQDYRDATATWEALNDPTADQPRWAEIELTGTWLKDNPEVAGFLDSQPLDVRVQVAHMVNERLPSRQGARAHRSSLTVPYLRGLVKEAKTFLTVKRPEW